VSGMWCKNQGSRSDELETHHTRAGLDDVGLARPIVPTQNTPIGASDRTDCQGVVQTSPARVVCAHRRSPARRGAANRAGGSFGGRQGRFGRLFSTDGPCRRAIGGDFAAVIAPNRPCSPKRQPAPLLPCRPNRPSRAGERPARRRALLRRQRACPLPPGRTAGRDLCNLPDQAARLRCPPLPT
jgi:hypothetical protein